MACSSRIETVAEIKPTEWEEYTYRGNFCSRVREYSIVGPAHLIEIQRSKRVVGKHTAPWMPYKLNSRPVEFLKRLHSLSHPGESQPLPPVCNYADSLLTVSGRPHFFLSLFEQVRSTYIDAVSASVSLHPLESRKNLHPHIIRPLLSCTLVTDSYVCRLDRRSNMSTRGNHFRWTFQRFYYYSFFCRKGVSRGWLFPTARLDERLIKGKVGCRSGEYFLITYSFLRCTGASAYSDVLWNIS